MSASLSELKNTLSSQIRSWLVLNDRFSLVEDWFDHGVYIYGAGELGALAIEYCEASHIPILGIIDCSRTGYLQSMSGYRYTISAPDLAAGVLDKNACVAVAIATVPYEPIRVQLQDFGWRYVIPFYNLTSTARSGHPLQNGWELGNVTKAEIYTVDSLCENWCDLKSWKHYEAFLAWHRNNTEVDLAECPIESDQRYVIPELLEALAHRKKQFVDIGSHRGESVGRLAKAGVNFAEYFFFEPDSLSRACLLSNLREMQLKKTRVTVFRDILWSDHGSLSFQDGLGYCSQVWAKGQEERQVVTLDSFNLSPDFLKVHTEGSELEILRGARGTIARSMPCIAFSVYHRREGFCSDIADAMAMFSGYRWFFRLHGYQGTGGFVYAIPETILNNKI